MKRPNVVLEGENRDRFESTVGNALQTAAGVARGLMVGAHVAAAGVVAAGVDEGSVVGATVGAIGAAVAKWFGRW